MPTLTIDIPPAQALRIAAALGKEKSLTNEDGTPRSATMAEYRAWVIERTKQMVQGVEYNEARAAVAVPAPIDVE